MIRVTVTEKHLEQGDQETASYNALSLAIAEAAGKQVLGLAVGGENFCGCELVWFWGGVSVFFSWEGYKEFPLPREADIWLAKLFAGDKVPVPFSFDIDLE